MDIDRGVVTQPDTDVGEFFQVASAANLEYVEVMLDGLTDREWLTTAAMDGVLDTHDDIGVSVHLPFMGLDLGAPSDGVRAAVVEELHACHKAADEAGAREAVLHPNALAWPRAYDDSYLLERVTTSIQELNEQAQSAGLTTPLSVENIYDSPIGFDNVLSILDATDTTLTFDTGHARIEGMDMADMCEVVADNASRLSTIHLNDTRRPTDEHLPVGAGTIDFAALFDALPADWSGNVSLEVTTPNMAYIEHSANHIDTILADQ